MTEYDQHKYSNYRIRRKRYIPEEDILLNNDVIHYISDDLILTSWIPVKKRSDMSSGLSAYYPKLGIKVSKKIASDGTLLYWYNDIMELSINNNLIVMNDMLLDLLIYPDKSVKLVDCDEFAEAIEKNLITKEQSAKSMRSLSELLTTVYSGRYDTLKEPVEKLAEYLKEHGT